MRCEEYKETGILKASGDSTEYGLLVLLIGRGTAPVKISRLLSGLGFINLDWRGGFEHREDVMFCEEE